ncbi:YbjN domain-containing protein [Caenispirillum salinarum]|uniref:YbjN domain-containing protein n=1 Tax=Caenispirillum salinarum TaxID=859058 RepID=UPI00384D6820
MYSAPLDAASLDANPIDLVETVALSRDWPVDRPSAQEAAMDVPGHWCEYGLFFAWSQDLESLHFTCAFDMRIPKDRWPDAYELLAHLNERMWLGHFALWHDDGIPMFRHTAMLRHGLNEETLEELMDLAVEECERFHPAFQFLIDGGMTARQAIDAAMLDTVGEA